MTNDADRIAQLKRSRNWLLIGAAAAAASTLVKFLGFIPEGFFSPWFATALLLVLLGAGATAISKLIRLQASLKEPPEKDGASGWSEVRTELSFYLWFALGAINSVCQLRMKHMFDEFGIKLPFTTGLLLNPYSLHMFIAIGFGFLTAASLTRRLSTRRRIGLISLVLVTVTGLIAVYSYGYPLLHLVMSLG